MLVIELEYETQINVKRMPAAARCYKHEYALIFCLAHADLENETI